MWGFGVFFCLFVFKDFIYFRQKGREGEREVEKHQCVFAFVRPTGDLARNPGTCTDWESNWRPPGSQASTQSTEPHQPGRALGTVHDSPWAGMEFHIP